MHNLSNPCLPASQPPLFSDLVLSPYLCQRPAVTPQICFLSFLGRWHFPYSSVVRCVIVTEFCTKEYGNCPLFALLSAARWRASNGGFWGPRTALSNRNVTWFYLIYFFKIYLFIYLWLHWVFVAAHGLSLAVASPGYSLLRCAVCGLLTAVASLVSENWL